jgi:tripartite-type tricarboxylate transporter receptor subunit TctC
MQNCMRMLVATIIVAVYCGMTAPVTADTYPSRPITIIVPFAAGGPFDTIARIIAEGMRGHLGQPIIIEDVAGAAGSLGVGRVARASPDGYTLSIGNWGTHVVNGAMYSLSYDTFADFEPIALLSNSPELIVAKSAVPANDLKQFIAYLKNNSDKASMGTSGVGSSGHVAGFLFQKATGTSFQFVPYRGLAPAMQDLIGGRTDMMIDMPSNSLPYIRSGAIKAFAVMDKQRLASAPDIPTVDEAGLPGFYATIWYALWAPKGTPTDIITKLNAAVRKALADPTVQRRLSTIDQTIFPPEQQTPEALRAYHKSEIDKWWPIIKDANIKIQ